MLTGGFDHVPANTFLPYFVMSDWFVECLYFLYIYIYIYICLFVCLLLVVQAQLELLYLEYSDVMFCLNIILPESGFILFCFIYFSWDTSRLGELLKNRAVPAVSQISSKSSKTSELIQQNSGGSQCKLDNRILL